ncbi:MAG: S49 family peptidase [Gammaproteobacteria bacterium]|nr:S49 family peptidase [Gammaproteobacteria bacterium]
MPNWNQLLDEIRSAPSIQDQIRRQYLSELHAITNRNTIAYYSAWLQKAGVAGTEINDEDKNGFMTVIHQMDRQKGLDLILHTPGGDAAATESLVDYLRSMFGQDIRVVIPQLAMSGGTMIACAAREILMGKQSSLGPIDPQFSGIPAHGVVEEFARAKMEIEQSAAAIPVWQPIIAKYPPAFVGECEKAIAWSNEMTKEWLSSGMFAGDKSAGKKIAVILEELGDHALTKSHARHLPMIKCREMGLKISALEDNQELQDAVLSVHHACMLTLSQTQAVKIIENQQGTAFIKMADQMVMAAPRVPNQYAEDEGRALGTD